MFTWGSFFQQWQEYMLFVAVLLPVFGLGLWLGYATQKHYWVKYMRMYSDRLSKDNLKQALGKVEEYKKYLDMGQRQLEAFDVRFKGAKVMLKKALEIME